ncbi:MAG: hypothetical protein ACT4NL_17180 [Pseudomarimonas sp.]
MLKFGAAKVTGAAGNGVASISSDGKHGNRWRRNVGDGIQSQA